MAEEPRQWRSLMTPYHPHTTTTTSSRTSGFAAFVQASVGTVPCCMERYGG
jgi:hypothetical protein